MATPTREAVGTRFDPALMQHARERTWAALHGIRARMHPGISEDEAKIEAAEVFRELGFERLWHPAIIRIGANTTKTYRQRSDPNVRLGENDSYFIDLGLVFDGHEGDVGDTFVVGHAPLRQACADAARALFGEVADAWRTLGLSGQALYAFAGERAAAMGWQFGHHEPNKCRTVIGGNGCVATPVGWPRRSGNCKACQPRGATTWTCSNPSASSARSLRID